MIKSRDQPGAHSAIGGTGRGAGRCLRRDTNIDTSINARLGASNASWLDPLPRYIKLAEPFEMIASSSLHPALRPGRLGRLPASIA